MARPGDFDQVACGERLAHSQRHGVIVNAVNEGDRNRRSGQRGGIGDGIAFGNVIRSAAPVPVTLVHGVDDDTVPLRMSQAFTAGRLVEIPGAGHFDLIDPQSPAWPRVLSVLAGTPSDGRS